MIISHLKLNGILQPETVSEQMINGLIYNNFTFYRTLIGVHIWWAKLFKAVLILLIAIRLFELLAPVGFGIMCCCFWKKIYLFYLVSLSFAAIYYLITIFLLVFLLYFPLFTSYTFPPTPFSFSLTLCFSIFCFGILHDFSGDAKSFCP